MNRSEFEALLAPAAMLFPSTTSISPASSALYDNHLHNPILSPPEVPPQSPNRKLRTFHQQTDSAPAPAPAPRSRSHTRQVSSMERNGARTKPVHRRASSCSTRSFTSPTVQSATPTVALNAASGPDFSVHEREAWSKRSPSSSPISARTRYSTKPAPIDPSSHPRSPTLKTKHFVLYPPIEHAEPLPQPRKQQKEPLPLRPFEPLRAVTNIEQRPKTSRGPRQSLSNTDLHASQSLPGDRSGADRGHSANFSETLKQPEFAEATTSMDLQHVYPNSVCSHENECDGPKNSDIELEVTLKTSELSTESEMLESSHEKPLPQTPSTTKKNMFRFGGGSSQTGGDNIGCFTNGAEELDDKKGEKQERKRKGLRKSLSTWSFQGLGEKVRLFGESVSDFASRDTRNAATREVEDQDKGNGAMDNLSTTGASDNISVQRKRKIEDLPSQPFGFKRRKSSLELAAAKSAPGTPGRQSTSQHTLTPSRLLRRGHVESTDVPNPSGREGRVFELRKRPSRKDLEKENRQLRAMLKESQNTSRSQLASSSAPTEYGRAASNANPVIISVLSPGETGDLANKENQLFQSAAITFKDARTNEEGDEEDVPPVPKLPPREVLKSMQNNTKRQSSRRGRKNMGPQTKLLSIIMDKEEEEERQPLRSAAGEHHADVTAPQMRQGSNGQWEWPEDVF